MYVNKCIKCGAEFETKNPKRVICPNCLYAEKGESSSSSEGQTSSYSSESYSQSRPQGSYSYGGSDRDQRPRNNYSREGGYQGGGYNRDRNAGGYQRRDNSSYGGGQSYGGGASYGGGYNRDRNAGGYQRRDNSSYGGGQSYGGGASYGGGYNRDRNAGQDRGGYQQRSQGGYNRDNRAGGQDRGGYQQRSQVGYNRDNRAGGFNNRRPQGGGRFGGAQRRPQRPQKPAKPLLVTKEQLEVIEALYKTMLPLPNPDAHEVIGEKMGLEPRKVFFGINLVRQQLMLPKLPFPKRKLAISEDQLLAIKSLYEPLLPLPPIGCHKIIATQLRMDEWRVHVGIGLIRGQMGLERWNQERDDAPEEYKKQAEAAKVEEPVVEEKPKAKRATKKKAVEEEVTEVADEPVVEKKTRGRKKAEPVAEEVSEEPVAEEKPKAKRTTRKTKKDEE